MSFTEPGHPAKYSASIMEALAAAIDGEADRLGRPVRVLDPFAGVGRIHRLPYGWDHSTVGIEIEPRWALATGSIPGDARLLPFRAGSFDVVATSPCYANRMADGYDGSRDTCTDCRGTGSKVAEIAGAGATREEAVADLIAQQVANRCDRCGGSGFAASRRQTYRIALGQKLASGSAAGMQWAKPYRDLHRAAWTEARRVLAPGGLLLVNVSNHVRGGKIQHVAEWHLVTLLRLGFLIVTVDPIDTPRMRHGANYHLRADAELLLVLRDPRPKPEENT